MRAQGGWSAAGRRGVVGWCLYDWAMSAFNTVILTFVFGLYFTTTVAPDPEEGARLWGLAIGVSGIAVALLSPVLGAIADKGGPAKPWLGVLTTLCLAATALLFFTAPTPSGILLALVAVAVAAAAFELANVFYNSLLPTVAPPGWMGRVSGWGWGIGYLGGLGSLVLCLVLLIQTETPLFGLVGTDGGENIRATAVLVAAWYGLFALPLFLLVRDRPSSGLGTGAAVRAGLKALRETVATARHHANTVRFLIASALWRDGINTITAFGGIFAGTLFGMTTAQVIVFAILLNVSAGLGAIGFGWVDDRAGAKPTLVVSLVGLTLTGLCLLLVGTPAWAWAPDLPLPLDFTPAEEWLLVFGLGLGIFFGPAQAAARTMMARLSPAGLETEFFGLYALTGRAVGFIGPFAYGWAAVAFDSQRAGMATVLVLFLGGLALLATVRAPETDGGRAVSGAAAP